MQWSESRHDGFPLVHLSGEVDLDSSPELREVLQARLPEQLPVLILDFTGVGYMDSSGIATLVEYVKKAGIFGGTLAVAGLGESLSALFELTRMDELMPRFATPDEACAAYR